MAQWVKTMNWVHSYGEQSSPGILWPQRIRYALDPNNKRFSGDDLDTFETLIGPRLSLFKTGFPLIPGRLASSLEGEGKRRIFAISNYVNQRLLLPVHEWAMRVLSSLSTDGTFDQLKPFFLLKGKLEYYCFDLKAATDRIPLLLLFEVVQHCFDRNFASSCVNVNLASHCFWPLPKDDILSKKSKSQNGGRTS